MYRNHVLDLFVNIAFISVVPQESISNNNNIDEAIAATFFYRLFGKSVVVRTALIVLSVIGTAAAGVWSYWIFYFATGIGLLLIRRNKKNELKKKQFDMNDKELNENSSLFSNITQEYKVPLPFAIIFILAGLFILVFSFVVNVECPKDKPNCDLREKTAQQLAPILISYGLLFVALTSVVYFIHGSFFRHTPQVVDPTPLVFVLPTYSILNTILVAYTTQLVRYSAAVLQSNGSESLLVDCCCDITLDSTGNYFYWRWVDFF
ncbi:unnamed protein product [Rhizophagus irregularis]|nr:unnamed protein product [Rhizophagus irregularis]